LAAGNSGGNIVKSGQFFKGMINGVEESYESPDLLQVLPNNRLSEVWDLDVVGIYSRVFLSERVIAQTVVERAVPDEHGRDGVTNHTVLYRFDAFMVHDGARYRFDEEQFVRDVKAGKYSFQMPPPPELKRPLDYPLKLEVEQ
jgi:hypothetical protein